MARSVQSTGARGLLLLAAVVATAAGTLAGGGPRRLATRAPGAWPILGFGISAHHIGELALYLDAVDSIAGLGANTLLLTTPMYQQRVDSSDVRWVAERCPTREQLSAIIDRGRQRGLQTILLPVVLIEEPGETGWRGVIDPADRDAWWASYERFLDYFTDLAARTGVAVLAVGSELNSFEHETGRWAALIDRVRARFPGRVTYSANWDRFDAVTFWDKLDFISVSAYFELARDDPDAPESALAAAWRDERDRLLAFAGRWDRRLLLMEVGYPSLPWAAAHPWDYVARDGAAADHDAQARCWRAFFDAWSGAVAGGQVLGFNGYRWDPYHHGDAADTGYGVGGKPARRVIRRGLARLRGETGVDR